MLNIIKTILEILKFGFTKPIKSIGGGKRLNEAYFIFVLDCIRIHAL